MNSILCVRAGSTGQYQQFDDLDDAIDHLNDLLVGEIKEWVGSGFITRNFSGTNYVRIFWGDPASNFQAGLDDHDRYYVEHNLEGCSDQGFAYLWVRVGDAGEYERCDDLDDAIAYLNELRVGKITGWVRSGFETENFYGHDYVSIFHGDDNANHLCDIGENEDEPQEYHRQYVECNLEVNYL